LKGGLFGTGDDPTFEQVRGVTMVHVQKDDFVSVEVGEEARSLPDDNENVEKVINEIKRDTNNCNLWLAVDLRR
jgi:hypothetical protein